MTRTKTSQSKYLRPIRRGEYDLANVSIMGHDPTDGRTYEECHAEWDKAFTSVKEDGRSARWWQLRRKLRLRYQAASLSTHLGMN